MARICSGCNKFGSIDDGAEVEVESAEIEDTMLITEVMVNLVSQCCGETMAYASMTSEIDLEAAHDCKAEPGVCQSCGGGGETYMEPLEDGEERNEQDPSEPCAHCGGSGDEPWEDELDDGADRFEVDRDPEATFLVDSDPALKTNPKTGKTKYTSPRYLRTYYGAELTGSVTCLRCKETFEVEDTVKDQASSFESY